MKWRIAIVGLAILVAIVGIGPSSHRIAAAQGEARSYVFAMSCNNQSPVQVSFVIPSIDDVRWTLASAGAHGDPDAVWIDLSLSDNGFAPGTFINAGPFRSAQDGLLFVWGGVLADRAHFYRLNAHVNDRWVSLGEGTFSTPNCSDVTAVNCYGADNAVTFEIPFRSAILPPGAQAGVASLTEVQNWLDLSLLDNGFAAATFIGARTALPPTEFSWVGLRSGLRHFYRRNTLFSDGAWHAQAFGSFASLPCYGLPDFQAPL